MTRISERIIRIVLNDFLTWFARKYEYIKIDKDRLMDDYCGFLEKGEPHGIP